MLAIHPFITFSRLSERDNGVKYNTTGLEDHREPFTDDIAYNIHYHSSLKKHIMLLFFRICLGKNVWKLQASNCGPKLFVYHP